MQELFLHGNTRQPFIKEDLECLENFENWMMFSKMPWELGLSEFTNHEDIAAIKEMRKWQLHVADQEREREQRRAGLKERAMKAWGQQGQKR